MDSRMKSLPQALILLCAVCSLTGCGDDDPTGTSPYGTGVVGTWVRYAALRDGVADPNGGVYGTAGHTITINGDGTGSAIDVPEVGVADPHPFTWTRDGDTFTVIADGGAAQPDTFAVEMVVSGNTLTLSEPDLTVAAYQRYVGAGVLVGRWDVRSVVDDYGHGSFAIDPGDLELDFRRDGSVIVYNYGAAEDTLGYEGDGPVVTVDGSPFVFSVVGRTLYLFDHLGVGSGEMLLIMEFGKL